MSTQYSLRPKLIQFETVWKELRPSVIDIITLQPISKLTWNHKFCDVYDICVAVPEPLSERLYQSLVDCLAEHVTAQYEKISEVPAGDLLHEYYNMWNIYYQGTQFIHNLFGYLNKGWVKQRKSTDVDAGEQFITYLQRSDVKEVGCMALDIWKERLVKPIHENLVTLILGAIKEDRMGKPSDQKSVVAGVILSFVQVEQYDFDASATQETDNSRPERVKEFYSRNFEAKFLEDTRQYYSSLAQKMLADQTCSQYMESVIEVLEAEQVRSSSYLHKSSVKKVVALCQDVMINAHKDKLHAVCSDLIMHEERKDLRNMYKLLKPLQSGLQVMIKEFEEYVKKKGLEVVQPLQGDNVPQQFVDNVLQVYDKFSDMKTEVFLDDGDFAGGLDKALQSVVNYREKTGVPPKASERLARYTDALLRKTAKGLTDIEVDGKLSRAIIIFRYIEDKDIFLKFYSKMLALRLINGYSLSMDSEETMINKLKQACGYEYTCKLSKMFTDVGLSAELSEGFHKFLTDEKMEESKNAAVMTPLILTAGSWPLSIPSIGGSGTVAHQPDAFGFVLPPSLQPHVTAFETYYGKKYTGRKLSWLFNSSHGELKMTYLDKSYVVQASVHQMAVILCFQTLDTVTVSDIRVATGLTGDLLLKVVRTIIDTSICNSDDKENLSDTSTVSLNMTLTSKRVRFRLPAPQLNKQIEKETETVNNTVSQDRKYYMECAIVRIMKTRKVLKHQALINEVMEQIKGRFKPDVMLVKKSIEDLIEKLYIQRTDQNDEYQYLA